MFCYVLCRYCYISALAGGTPVRLPDLSVTALITHALKSAGGQRTLFSDSGPELLRQAPKGFPRQAGNILHSALRPARPGRQFAPVAKELGVTDSGYQGSCRDGPDAGYFCQALQKLCLGHRFAQNRLPS